VRQIFIAANEQKYTEESIFEHELKSRSDQPIAYLRVQFFAVASYFARSVLYIWAISGTRGSSGFGSVRREHIESKTYIQTNWNIQMGQNDKKRVRLNWDSKSNTITAIVSIDNGKLLKILLWRIIMFESFFYSDLRRISRIFVVKRVGSRYDIGYLRNGESRAPLLLQYI
jgi:hypothetical protein